MGEYKKEVKPAKITKDTHEKLVKLKGEYEFKQGKQISLFMLMEELVDIAFPIWRKNKNLED